VTLQAIADRLGIGPVPVPVLDREFSAGRLVAPFPDIMVQRAGYVALVPFDTDKTSSLAAFLEWLLEEAGR